jgi:hypothetical protein
MTKPYRVKLTREQHRERQQELIKRSPLYREIISRDVSNRTLTKILQCRLQYIYEIFMNPVDHMNFKRLKAIYDLLGDKSVREILEMMLPEYKEAWWEVDDVDTDELFRRMGI